MLTIIFALILISLGGDASSQEVTKDEFVYKLLADNPLDVHETHKLLRSYNESVAQNLADLMSHFDADSHCRLQPLSTTIVTVQNVRSKSLDDYLEYCEKLRVDKCRGAGRNLYGVDEPVTDVQKLEDLFDLESEPNEFKNLVYDKLSPFVLDPKIKLLVGLNNPTMEKCQHYVQDYENLRIHGGSLMRAILEYQFIVRKKQEELCEEVSRKQVPVFAKFILKVPFKMLGLGLERLFQMVVADRSEESTLTRRQWEGNVDNLKRKYKSETSLIRLTSWTKLMETCKVYLNLIGEENRVNFTAIGYIESMGIRKKTWLAAMIMCHDLLERQYGTREQPRVLKVQTIVSQAFKWLTEDS